MPSESDSRGRLRPARLDVREAGGESVDDADGADGAEKLGSDGSMAVLELEEMWGGGGGGALVLRVGRRGVFCVCRDE